MQCIVGEGAGCSIAVGDSIGLFYLQVLFLRDPTTKPHGGKGNAKQNKTGQHTR